MLKTCKTPVNLSKVFMLIRSYNIGRRSVINQDKLYFVSLSRAPAPQEGVHFFTIDNTFVYTNFYADFGPSNMSHVVRFCDYLQNKFEVFPLCVDVIEPRCIWKSAVSFFFF